MNWLYFLTWKKRTTISGISDFTSQKTDWKLIYSERFLDRASAIKREKEIKKKKSGKYIEWFNQQPFFINKLKKRLQSDGYRERGQGSTPRFFTSDNRLVMIRGLFIYKRTRDRLVRCTIYQIGIFTVST